MVNSFVCTWLYIEQQLPNVRLQIYDGLSIKTSDKHAKLSAAYYNLKDVLLLYKSTYCTTRHSS